MPKLKKKIVSVSVNNPHQEMIYNFLKLQDRSTTDLVWSALELLYYLPALFDRSDEIGEMEKTQGAIEIISRIEGELVRAKLLAKAMKSDCFGDRIDFSPTPITNRSSVVRSRTDSVEESDGSRAKKPLPKVTF